MQALEYLVVISALLFSLTFFWLLSVSGLFDCLKTSPIKSAFHCLSLITTQCDQAIANSLFVNSDDMGQVAYLSVASVECEVSN